METSILKTAEQFQDEYNLDPKLYPFLVYHATSWYPMVFINGISKNKISGSAFGTGFYVSNDVGTMNEYMKMSNGYVYEVKVGDREKCYGKNGALTYHKSFQPQDAPKVEKAYQVVRIPHINQTSWWSFRGDASKDPETKKYPGDKLYKVDTDACELTIHRIFQIKYTGKS